MPERAWGFDSPVSTNMDPWEEEIDWLRSLRAMSHSELRTQLAFQASERWRQSALLRELERRRRMGARRSVTNE